MKLIPYRSGQRIIFGLKLAQVIVFLRAALLCQAQTFDTFNPVVDGSYVYSAAMQTDGKIIVAGVFTSLNAQARSFIGRLNSDGTLDLGFNPNINSGINTLALLEDGKILVGGGFTSVGGQARKYLARLNGDGSLDTTFIPGNPSNPGVSDFVNALCLQADGKILLGLSLPNTLGNPGRALIRLNANGSVDASFSPAGNGAVNALAIQADGKILEAGGEGLNLRPYLKKINLDGTLDTAFRTGASPSWSYQPAINCLTVRSDGTILVLGGIDFPPFLMGSLSRLDTDGNPDITFTPPNSPVLYITAYTLGLQVNGRILAGYGGSGVIRSNPDGDQDGAFTNLPTACYLKRVYLQSDGKILQAGQVCLRRINNIEPATQSLAFDGSTITWLRGGSSPEVWRTSFDVSTNGVDWARVGAGERITGGWQLPGLNYPTNSVIRARGFVQEGGSSSWFVESFLGRSKVGIGRSGDFSLLSIEGDVGKSYTLEHAPSLAPGSSWQPLTSLQLTNGTEYYLDASSSNAAQRFYRVRLSQ